MTETLYENNDVKITRENIDGVESKIDINGENLIWISNSEAEEFKLKLTGLLDKFRI
jgi:hypothetical protein